MDMSRKVTVKNRTKGMVGYKIDTLRVYRHWDKTGDVLFITIDELIELSTLPGGLKLLEKYLLIEDEEAIMAVFGREMEPEYKYTEKEIEFLLYKAEDDQLFDCLDYAPEGVLRIIRSKSIDRIPNTTAKVEAINKRLNINLSVIRTNAESPENDDAVVEVDQKRRSAPVVIEKTETQSRYKKTGQK